jgi:hypothetical protein
LGHGRRLTTEDTETKTLREKEGPEPSRSKF